MKHPDATLRVQTDLGAIHARVARDSQRIVQFVARALASPPLEATDAALLSDTGIGYVYFQPNEAQSRATDEEYPTWILLNGFRDLSERVGELLERVYEVRALWRLFEIQHERGSFTGRDWARELTDGQRKFHRLGMPDKLAALTQRYGLSLDANLQVQIHSINAVRNCLVHRGGIVSDRDVGEHQSLYLRWTRFAAYLDDVNGRREVIPPYVSEHGGMLSIVQEEAARAYDLGQRIRISAQEFAEIGWTVNLFAKDAADALGRLGRSIGVPFTDPDSNGA